MKGGPHHEFRCCECQTPNAAWGIDGKEYCSVCLPDKAIHAFTQSMTPGASMKFKRALLQSGNKALKEKAGG